MNLHLGALKRPRFLFAGRVSRRVISLGVGRVSLFFCVEFTPPLFIDFGTSLFSFLNIGSLNFEGNAKRGKRLGVRRGDVT